MKRRLVIRVYGRVQGVFFRHTARIHAAELDIAGWARNEDDGTLTITAEGDAAALETFLGWCRRGPPLAAVDRAESAWQEATGEFKRFEII